MSDKDEPGEENGDDNEDEVEVEEDEEQQGQSQSQGQDQEVEEEEEKKEEGGGGEEEEEGEELDDDEEYEDETDDEEGEEEDDEESSDDESVPEPPPPNPFDHDYFQQKIHAPQPTKLNLNGQLLKRAGTFYLSEAMKENTSITSLRLCRNELGVGGAQFLAEFIPYNSTLRRLDILQNHMCEEGTRRIAEALAEGDSGLEEIYGIDLSPYQEDIFCLKKHFTYEYGNIKLLQQLQVNKPIIALQKEEQRQREAEEAEAEAARLAKEREDRESELLMNNQSSFGNAAAGAFSKMSGMWGNKGASKKGSDQQDHGNAGGDYTDEDNVIRSDDDDGDGNAAHENANEDSLQEDVDSSMASSQEQLDDDNRTEIKLAKTLKFWGS